jgi:hypothetical protein
MPNHCSNVLIVCAPTKEIMDEVKAKLIRKDDD